MADFASRREQMVERQIARRGVADDRVLEAMRQVPREAFVSRLMREFAYEDSALPIEESQTISQPYIVAAMIEAAELKPGDRVLEIGAGSGYAAAVMGRIASQVFAIERHPRLASQARKRMQRQGYANVEIRCGDGTLGLPEEAPFDAIVVSAGGPHVPRTLREQLAVGGRLVIPVGSNSRDQQLIKLTRLGEDRFHEEDLGAVAFVPLIGEQGWSADGRTAAPRAPEPRSWCSPLDSLPEAMSEAAEPLREIDEAAFAAAFDRFAEAKVVLIGEASHGTSEFYRARAAITRRLIEQHGFNIVAVEADWPDAAQLDRAVRQLPLRADAPAPFARFPTWMWRNAEVAAFIRWLAGRNAELPAADRAGFHGLDLYSLSGSIRAVIDYLDEVDPEAAAVARERYGCLTPWSREPQTYGRMALSSGYAPCERAVVSMLKDLLDRRLDYAAKDGESFLDAAQNARLIRDAEAYYRAMYYGAAESWNLRDRHMFETLEQVLSSRGPGAKAVVWAHNSHIGDARFTEMGLVRDELNLGQLCRERFGHEAVLIGLGTHAGTVACASDWDGPLEIKQVRPSLEGSVEHCSHSAGPRRFLLDLREGVHEELRQRLLEPRLERFIGVIYRPQTERLSHYAEASLPRQFDAWVWFDETRALTPLPGPAQAGEDETWPFGL
jgi:protein-L-isoaspartate(D-aspartate) O-methyltransferase